MIVVAGSANIDFVTNVERIPAPGETVLGEAYRLVPGGKGANQAVACARAGGQVTFVGALGADPFAPLLRESLTGSGVTDATVEVPLPTGAAFISVTQEAENAITVASGANAALAPAHLPPLDGVTHLALQLEIPLDTVRAFAAAAREAGTRVVLNAAPMRPLDAGLLALVDLLVVNEGELAQLLGQTEPGEPLAALDRVLGLGPSAAVVTLGAQGCAAAWRSGAEVRSLRLPAFPVVPVDTTGAGDTFVGVLVAGLSLGLTLPDALRRATVGAALACTRPGAQPSMPGGEQIDAALAEPVGTGGGR